MCPWMRMTAVQWRKATTIKSPCLPATYMKFSILSAENEDTKPSILEINLPNRAELCSMTTHEHLSRAYHSFSGWCLNDPHCHFDKLM